MGRFETKVLTDPEHVDALYTAPSKWIGRDERRFQVKNNVWRRFRCPACDLADEFFRRSDYRARNRVNTLIPYYFNSFFFQIGY